MQRADGSKQPASGAQAERTIHFLRYVTTDGAQPFLVPEMIDRMAGMVNSFTVKLLGPQMGTLKVRDKNQLKFNPLQLLERIITLTLQLYRADRSATPTAAL